jgi:hypothetical protein
MKNKIPAFFDDFAEHSIDAYWTQTCIGSGQLSVEKSLLRMSLPTLKTGEYADAQIDDYGTLARANFPWQPPLRMEVRACSSLPAANAMSTRASQDMLCGTAGFGFWNYPFSVRGDILMLPEAVWFFYASPPSNMALVPGVTGWGWKAQVIHAMRPGALLSVIPTALATGWGLATQRTERAARWLQRLSGASEAILPYELTTWHIYTLEWHTTEALFWVDGNQVLRVPNPPTRALGFVAWLDNQYAIVSPRGILRFGSTACTPEWLDLDSIKITSQPDRALHQ